MLGNESIELVDGKQTVRIFSARLWGAGLMLAVAAGAQAAQPTLETFDADKAGFEANTTSSTVVFDATGGNPGGHLLVRKDLSPPVFDVGALTARADFTGDYAAAGIRQISVDLNFLTDTISDAWVRVRSNSTSNGWLFPLTDTFPLNDWNSYSVNFDPTWTDAQASAAGWLTDKDVEPIALASPPFADVMKSVGTLEIRLAGPAQSTLVGIDNVGIAVPEPSCGLLLGLGLLATGAKLRRRS